MITSFTKWDNSLSGTLGAGPMGVPLSEVLLYLRFLLAALSRHLDIEDNKYLGKQSEQIVMPSP